MVTRAIQILAAADRRPEPLQDPRGRSSPSPTGLRAGKSRLGQTLWRTATRNELTTVPRAAALRRQVQRLLLRSPVRRLFNPPHPPFMYTPPQLAYIGQLMEGALKAGGTVLEVGCSVGHTTVYLNRWLDAIGAEPRYYAFDTFAGFTDADLESEATRGNRSPLLGEIFRTGTRESFDHRMIANAITRVTPVVEDAALVSYEQYAPIAFALIDVDLYRPVKAALEGIYPALAPGGAVVVDDCLPTGLWRGAHAAYVEFCHARGIQPHIEHVKLGVLTKTADT